MVFVITIRVPPSATLLELQQSLLGAIGTVETATAALGIPVLPESTVTLALTGVFPPPSPPLLPAPPPLPPYTPGGRPDAVSTEIKRRPLSRRSLVRKPSHQLPS